MSYQLLQIAQLPYMELPYFIVMIFSLAYLEVKLKIKILGGYIPHVMFGFILGNILLTRSVHTDQ